MATAAERIKTRNLADLEARYKQQRAELNQGSANQKTELKQMVQNDAIARGMANSTVPGDRAVAGFSKIDQAATNALANLLNSYNADKNAILNQFDQMSMRGGGGGVVRPTPIPAPTLVPTQTPDFTNYYNNQRSIYANKQVDPYESYYAPKPAAPTNAQNNARAIYAKKQMAY